jgi:hypothetical protein
MIFAIPSGIIRPMMALVLLASMALPALARDIDAVNTSGPLSDSDFYHLAACGAAPGGDCKGPYVRWRASSVTVALLPAERGFPGKRQSQLSQALDQAIAQINGARAGIRLKRRDAQGAEAQIVVTPTAFVSGERTHGLTNVTSGAQMGVGYMSIYWSTNRRITRAGIAIAADIEPGEMDSVVLEELFQTLGFVFDIDNAAYEGVSILSETSNDTTTITGQDRTILRMHYPPS